MRQTRTLPSSVLGEHVNRKMITPVDPSAPASRLPTLQFKLQTIFFWTFVLSMALATIAPAFRSWKSEQRWVFIGMLLVQASIFGGVVAYSWRARFRAVAKAGNCEFRSSFATREYMTNWEKFKVIFPMLAAIGYQAFVLSIFSESHTNDMVFLSFGPQLQCTHYLASTCVAYWFAADSRDIEICERGYICGAFRYAPWKSLVSVRPGTYSPSSIVFIVLDANGMQATHTFWTDPNLRGEIIDQLSSRIATT